MYKIVTPQLLSFCKKDSALARMIKILPATNKPLQKAREDIAFSTLYLAEFKNDKELASAIRHTFSQTTASTPIQVILPKP